MNNVFIKVNKKNYRINDTYHCSSSTQISKKDMLKTIPSTATATVNLLKRLNNIEWRWRIYNINNHEFIEISCLSNGERRFLNNDNKWIKYSESLNEFEKFITTTYYYYSNK